MGWGCSPLDYICFTTKVLKYESVLINRVPAASYFIQDVIK